MKKNGELSLLDAENVIFGFFDGEIERTRLFMEIASHMIDTVPGARIRYNPNIIGVAKPRECYRFYVVKKDGSYSIKYKHQEVKHSLSIDGANDFMLYNTECNKYLDEHPEAASKKNNVAEEVKNTWASVVTHSEKALNVERREVENESLQAYYESIVSLLTKFAKNVFSQPASDIIVYRVLSEEGKTLQAIGYTYGISRERVRQIEVKKWSSLVDGFCRSPREVFVEYRKEICDILLGIDPSHYIQAMAYFLKKNERIGEMLIQVSEPARSVKRYRTEITQYTFKHNLEIKSGVCVPQSVVDAALKSMNDRVASDSIDEASHITKADKGKLIERAKMYLKLLGDGVHPVTGMRIPQDSVFMDNKVKRCFEFISNVLDEYAVLSEKVRKLEEENKKPAPASIEKQLFSITHEQRGNIKLSEEPLSVISFTKNINSVIDSDSMQKLTSTRLNKWLINRGLVTTSQMQTIVNKTVYKPSDLAIKIGIIEEETVDKKSGEIKGQIKLGEDAQLFILENIEEIISTT